MNIQKLTCAAENAGSPARTLDQVRDALTLAKKTKGDAALARLMLRHGRLTDEARAYVEHEYPVLWRDPIALRRRG